MSEIEEFIRKFHEFEFDSAESDRTKAVLNDFFHFIENSRVKKRKKYLASLEELEDSLTSVPFLSSRSDVLAFTQAKKALIDLAHLILEENKRIFIVHGRDMNMRDKVEALLAKLNLDTTILENEANKGSTVIEKFLSKGDDCRYAIILMSHDDEGSLIGGILKPRTRQNVVLELGYFLGKLGRKRIMILHPDEVEIEKPSDFDGIVYLPYDNKGAWKHKVIKELKAAKFYIDENDVDKI